jgi:hypothetical protein
MSTPIRISGPIHPLIAAYQQAQRDRVGILHQHTHTAADLLAHHTAHGVSYESVYAITGEAIGDRPYDERITWRYVGPIENHGDLANQRGYITIRTSDRDTNDVVAQLFPQLNDDAAYSALIKAAYEIAPQITLILTIGAASGAIEWDTGETIHQAATRIALDAAWSIRGEPGSGYSHTSDHVLDAARQSLGQRRPMGEYARNYLDNRDAIFADLDRASIVLGDPLLGSKDVAERAGIAQSGLRANVTRNAAPTADLDRGSRSPRWHEVTVTAWLATR